MLEIVLGDRESDDDRDASSLGIAEEPFPCGVFS
jgi:hypothetical protein